MAKDPVTIEGTTRKARSDGTTARKSTRDSLATFRKVGTILAVVGFVIITGYYISGWVRSDPENVRAEEREYSDPLPNGRTLYHPFKFELHPSRWKDVPLPRGTCARANPIGKTDFVQVTPDLTKIRSRTGRPEIVFITWKRSGECS